MDYTYKKIVPEDVFVSMLPANGDTACSNKQSGLEIIDIFARMIWHNPHKELIFYAQCLNISPNELNITVKVLTGIGALEWRNRFVNLAAHELLEDGYMSITEVAHRLGFNSTTTFSRYFRGLNKKSPTDLRFHTRGFNTNKTKAIIHKLKKEINESSIFPKTNP